MSSVKGLSRMELFVARAEELRNTSAVQRGLHHSVTIRLHKDHTGEVEEHAPNEAEFLAFLVVFRKFILKDEPVFLSAMLNLCEKLLADDDLRDKLRDGRKEWKAARRTGIGFEMNGRKLPPEETADIWIQGRIFHDDEKAAIFDNLPPPAYAFLRAQFMDYIFRTTEVILYVATVINKALQDGKVLSEPA